MAATTTTKAHNLVHLHRDRGYRFQDRAPDMEEVCPSNFTMTWVAYALGYERKWTKLQ